MNELQKTGEHLRTLRLAYGMTNKELAGIFGYKNQASYNNWERNGLNDLTKLGVLCHFYGGQSVRENQVVSIGRYVRYKLCQSEKTTKAEEQAIIKTIEMMSPSIRKARMEGRGDDTYILFKAMLKQEMERARMGDWRVEAEDGHLIFTQA